MLIGIWIDKYDCLMLIDVVLMIVVDDCCVVLFVSWLMIVC